MGRCNKENTSKRFRIYNYRSSRRADWTWFLLVTVSSHCTCYSFQDLWYKTLLRNHCWYEVQSNETYLGDHNYSIYSFSHICCFVTHLIYVFIKALLNTVRMHINYCQFGSEKMNLTCISSKIWVILELIQNHVIWIKRWSFIYRIHHSFQSHF